MCVMHVPVGYSMVRQLQSISTVGALQTVHIEHFIQLQYLTCLAVD